MKKSHRQRNAEIRSNIAKKDKKRSEARLKRQIKQGKAPEQPTVAADYKMLITKKIEMKETDMDLRPLMEQKLIPGPLHSVLFIASTGQGKTTTVLNWLLSPDFYKDFFDEQYLFSMSSDLDPMFKLLDLPDDHLISDNILPRLNEILSSQKTAVEKSGFKLAKNIQLIFEDATGNFDLLKSPLMITAFTMGRHLKLSVWVIAHKYKSLVPCIRLNASQIVLYPCNNGQRDQIIEDYLPAGVKKNCFKAMIKHAFKPTDEDSRPYLFIDNKSQGDPKRFRKGLYEFLEPNC